MVEVGEEDLSGLTQPLEAVRWGDVGGVCLGPCGRLLEAPEFSKMWRLPWGLEGWCNYCHHKRVHECWTLFKRAVSEGNLQRPAQCSKCGRSNKNGTPISGHHLNYQYPYFVEWLCMTCHSRVHRAMGADVQAIRRRGEVPVPQVPPEV